MLQSSAPAQLPEQQAAPATFPQGAQLPPMLQPSELLHAPLQQASPESPQCWQNWVPGPFGGVPPTHVLLVAHKAPQQV
jgi:hypothetical protein